MNRIANGALLGAGLLGCCAAAIQISQLLDGRAAPELFNYAVTGATTLIGLGLIGVSWWRRNQSGSSAPTDDRALVGALDLLFAHFGDDVNAQDAVRVVARSVTERRYRKPTAG